MDFSVSMSTPNMGVILTFQADGRVPASSFLGTADPGLMAEGLILDSSACQVLNQAGLE